MDTVFRSRRLRAVVRLGVVVDHLAFVARNVPHAPGTVVVDEYRRLCGPERVFDAAVHNGAAEHFFERQTAVVAH
ncbi:hypothetical protein D3C87_2021560 [compost metagenome]